MMLSLLPDSMLGIAIIAIGIAVIVGMSPRKGVGMIGSMILFVVLSPFIESLFAALPIWITLCVLGITAVHVLRMVLTFLFGKEATGHVVGSLVIGTGKLAGQGLLLPFRLARGVGRAVLRLRQG